MKRFSSSFSSFQYCMRFFLSEQKLMNIVKCGGIKYFHNFFQHLKNVFSFKLFWNENQVDSIEIESRIKIFACYRIIIRLFVICLHSIKNNDSTTYDYATMWNFVHIFQAKLVRRKRGRPGPESELIRSLCQILNFHIFSFFQ